MAGRNAAPALGYVYVAFNSNLVHVACFYLAVAHTYEGGIFESVYELIRRARCYSWTWCTDW